MKRKKAIKQPNKLIIDANRRLQDTAQKLFMAKKELAKKNKELREARKRELSQKKKFETLERAAMKRMAGIEEKREAKLSNKKKITRDIAEDISLSYIRILELYVKSRDLGKDEILIEELCRKMIEYGVTPKGIINIHLKSVPQIKTGGGLDIKRVTFESRMVLLKVMTQYASLVLKKGGG